MRRHDARVGFTLIEVMVALIVSAVVLLGARALLEALADQAQVVARAAERADRDGNAIRLLLELVRRMDVGSERGGMFTGTPTEASFTSWCDVPAGWQERCRVVLRIQEQSPDEGLLVTIDDKPALLLRESCRPASLRYLVSAANGGRWVTTWAAGVTTPLALAVTLDSGSLVLPVGVGT